MGRGVRRGSAKNLEEGGPGGDNVDMKNITVSLDDETYRRARVRAAELDTSVSAVVRDYLVEFAGGQTDFERRKTLQQRALSSIKAFRAGSRLTRAGVHDRDALR